MANIKILSDQCTISDATSNYTTSYAELDDEEENEFHEIRIKDENYASKHQRLELRKLSDPTNGNLSDDPTSDEMSDDVMVNFGLENELSLQSLTLKCDICQRSFRSRSLLEEHLTNVHNETKFIYDMCRICTKTVKAQSYPIFVSLLGLTQHVVKYHQYNGAFYACDMCSMSFCQETGMKLHMHFTHGDGRNGARYTGPIM